MQDRQTIRKVIPLFGWFAAIFLKENGTLAASSQEGKLMSI